MPNPSKEVVKKFVRERYGRIAVKESDSCCGGGGSDCGSKSEALGYSAEELKNLPDGADLGLGCGNPQAIANLKPGETVLDLGSGAGIDCFLAANRVGPEGRVIGVDMTHEMLAKARENAVKGGFKNTEFRLGEIEHLPVANDTVDVIISNCVINLSPDKELVFKDAFRVLKPGGRLAVSDVVAMAELPEEVKKDLALHAGCIAGAMIVTDLERILRAIGFEDVRIEPKDSSRRYIKEWAPGSNVEDYVLSANITARKP